MAGQRHDPLIQGFAQTADLQSVFCDLFLSPAVGHRAQQGNQGGRGGEDHPLLDAILDQGWILLQCGTEEGLARQEQDGEFRRRPKLIPVCLCPECLDMVADLLGMAPQAGGSAVFIGHLQGFQISLERRLGIDDDILASRQPDDHVGPQATIFRRGRFLLDKIAVFDHSRHLHDPLKLDLAPAAADDRGAKGADEIGRFTLQLFLGQGQGTDLFRQSRVG